MLTLDASNRKRNRLVSVGNMSKEELVLRIAGTMHKGCGQFGNFNAYLCIKGFFLDLEMADLIGIAGQYRIVVPNSDGT